MKRFSQYIQEEIVPQVDSPFDEVAPQSIIQVMEPEKQPGLGDRPVYLVYRGRVGEWLSFRFSDDCNGNEFAEILRDKHFHRRERDVVVNVNHIPCWFSNFKVIGNLDLEQEKSFK